MISWFQIWKFGISLNIDFFFFHQRWANEWNFSDLPPETKKKSRRIEEACGYRKEATRFSDVFECPNFLIFFCKKNKKTKTKIKTTCNNTDWRRHPHLGHRRRWLYGLDNDHSSSAVNENHALHLVLCHRVDTHADVTHAANRGVGHDDTVVGRRRKINGEESDPEVDIFKPMEKKNLTAVNQYFNDEDYVDTYGDIRPERRQHHRHVVPWVTHRQCSVTPSNGCFFHSFHLHLSVHFSSHCNCLHLLFPSFHSSARLRNWFQTQFFKISLSLQMTYHGTSATWMTCETCSTEIPFQ